MIRIVEYSVLLLESDAFQKNSWLSVEILSHCFGRREGAASFIHPPKRSSQLLSPCHALPCSDFKNRQHWNFSLFLLWTDCSHFRCKLDCVIFYTRSCMDRFFFFSFSIYKNQLENELFVFIWGTCPCAASGTLWIWDFPWQLLLLLAEGFPLIHCDQLKLTAKMS